jgi:hypothetical protein
VAGYSSTVQGVQPPERGGRIDVCSRVQVEVEQRVEHLATASQARVRTRASRDGARRSKHTTRPAWRRGARRARAACRYGVRRGTWRSATSRRGPAPRPARRAPGQTKHAACLPAHARVHHAARIRRARPHRHTSHRAGPALCLRLQVEPGEHAPRPAQVGDRVGRDRRARAAVPRDRLRPTNAADGGGGGGAGGAPRAMRRNAGGLSAMGRFELRGGSGERAVAARGTGTRGLALDSRGRGRACSTRASHAKYSISVDGISTKSSTCVRPRVGAASRRGVLLGGPRVAGYGPCDE